MVILWDKMPPSRCLREGANKCGGVAICRPAASLFSTSPARCNKRETRVCLTSHEHLLVVISIDFPPTEIDPVYFDKSYYVVPTGAEKAFSVLLSAMQEEGKAAIAKSILGTKETLIMIRAKDGKMLLNTMFFAEEIAADPAKAVTAEGSAQELQMAKAIIGSMAGEFHAEEYRDEYRERLQAAIERKIAGKQIVSPKEKNAGSITDLMEALTKSLELAQKPKTPVRRATRKKKAQ